VYKSKWSKEMQSSDIEPGTPRQSAGEKAILEAAVQLFSKNGFDGVSMRDIAEAAGVSKSNIYHHFKSKRVLYRSILRASTLNRTWSI
jgi:AcrR family transcriptional regulator